MHAIISRAIKIDPLITPVKHYIQISEFEEYHDRLLMVSAIIIQLDM